MNAAPHSRAKPTAAPASRLKIFAGLPVRINADTPISSAPPAASSYIRSPKNSTAATIVSSGPVARASG